MKEKIKINFEDFWFPSTEEAIKESTLYKILSKRFDLELAKKPDFLIYSCFGKNYLKYECVRIFYTGENVRPDFDDCDYSFSFDFPVTEKNYRLPLYKLYTEEFDMVKNKNRNIEMIINEKRKFCNFLYSNKRAQERIEFFHKLQEYKKVDSGGKLLNNLGLFVEDKMEFLRNYKFTIAFENSSYPGYTSEKILHSFAVDSIPIYWGNPLIGRDFNPKSFVNCHDYESFDDVVKIIIEIDNDDDLYKKYLSEPAFKDNLENEFVNEKNILDRFEEIFFNKNIKRVARKTDQLRYYGYLIYPVCKKNIKKRVKRIRRFIKRIIR